MVYHKWKAVILKCMFLQLKPRSVRSVWKGDANLRHYWLSENVPLPCERLRIPFLHLTWQDKLFRCPSMTVNSSALQGIPANNAKIWLTAIEWWLLQKYCAAVQPTFGLTAEVTVWTLISRLCSAANQIGWNLAYWVINSFASREILTCTLQVGWMRAACIAL